MALIVVGISHQTAPIEIREKLSFNEENAKNLLHDLIESETIQEAVLLSTCNRTEIYSIIENVDSLNGQFTHSFTQYGRFQQELPPTLFYQNIDRNAVQHLFRVAAGLDSMVVGEAQILGQVKQAYVWSTEVGATNTLLNKLFHHSFRVGKQVRTETKIGVGAVSVASVAVDLAHKIFRDFSDKKVVLIGAGEMALQTINHLKSNGIHELTIINRTHNRAKKLASEMGGIALPFDSMQQALVSADMVITSTAASKPILTEELLNQIMLLRKNRPLFLIDIAVPRNIDPAIRDIYNTYLYNIDDLQNIVSDNLDTRRNEIPKAEKIVSNEVNNFMSWYDSLPSIYTIQQLQQHFEGLRQQELKRNKKYFNEKDWESMDRFSQSLMKKFLHSPIMRLKTCPESGNVCQRCTVKEVFGLEEECLNEK